MSRIARFKSGVNAMGRRIFAYAAVLLVVFLLGFVPMWGQSREVSRSLAESQQQLTVARMQNTLASAAIEARQGDYEPSHQSTGDFFTAVQAEINKGADSAFSPVQSEGIGLLLTQRDELITLLARSDPAAAGRLGDLYNDYREVVK
jgi:hypothetical protein